MDATAALISKVDLVSKAVRASRSSQIFSAGVKGQLHDLTSEYFSSVKPFVDAGDFDADGLDGIFREIHALSRKSPSKNRCLELLKAARGMLVTWEGAAISQRARAAPPGNQTDELICSTLDEICPSASLAYRQALVDLAQERRLSWRGPATDLREALRETLDVLAPDAEVEAMPGFKLEQDAKHPTMKQKVRFILKNRGVPSGAMAPPEHAVQGVEDVLGTLTRSVYTRSSVSTHTPTEKSEVARVHAWVRIVLCELLEIPLA